jgi:glycosyltransferase involved in cell wall biosynthesis
MMDGMSSAERVKTIGLCMIVKNEAHVILGCLDSVRPLVDYVLIEDTGSTDGTQQIVMDWLSREGLPGEIVEEPWRDFAYNRSHALAKLREVEYIDYSLIIDADDVLVIDTGVDVEDLKKNLAEDSYSIDIRHGPICHQRTQICRNQKPFSFRGVIHEFLVCPSETATAGYLSGISMSIVGGGARGNDAEKYRRDAELIENALSSETDAFLRSRYTFYLAQSYHDCGERQKSLETYLQRAEMGYWNEEVYISLLTAARLKEALNYPFDDIIATYQRATDTVPTRAEAIHGASRYCRILGRNREGYAIGKTGIDLSSPSGLFVERWIYDYGLLDEFAINAYWAGQYAESLSASLRVLGQDKISAADRARIVKNAEFASGQLNERLKLDSAMPDLEWNKLTWSNPRQWEDGGDGWSEGWGGPQPEWYGTIFPRIARWLPVARLLEIAPGAGRWTQFLLGQTSEYYGVDFSETCVEQCRKRFAGFNKARFFQNNGRSLEVIPDDSIDFVFSFDSLVHVELDVIADYCEQIIKKLSHCFGVAFLHHSNALMGVDNVEVLYPQRGRATSVSSAAVREIIERAGGRVLIQEEVNWQSKKRIDCMTTFCRNTCYTHLEYRLIQNDNFMTEMRLIGEAIRHYY